MHVEDALSILVLAGFTLAEADACRKAVCKRLSREAMRFRAMFLATGHSEAAWEELCKAVRAGSRCWKFSGVW